jgi:hypothetical protein
MQIWNVNIADILNTMFLVMTIIIFITMLFLIWNVKNAVKKQTQIIELYKLNILMDSKYEITI